jgi:hypothetical protein
VNDLYQALVVVSIVPAAFLIDYAWKRIDLWAASGLAPLLDAALGAQDHVSCANPDCDQTICVCPRPAECVGCTTLGCDHLNPHGGLLCWDCRLECSECAAEQQAVERLAWEAGR